MKTSKSSRSGLQCCTEVRLSSIHAEAAGRFCWKQSRHSTGRPWVGLKGTVVSLPHCEQMARVSILVGDPCGPLAGLPRFAARLALQFLHRLGSFLNRLSWKNICSPDVNTKSTPQSTHFNILSWNSIEDAPSARSRPHSGAREEKYNPFPSARVRRIFATSPSVELPLGSARHVRMGHGSLLLRQLRRSRGLRTPPSRNARYKKGRSRSPRGSGLISISLALSELFSGCVCAPRLPSRAFSRRASDKRSGV